MLSKTPESAVADYLEPNQGSDGCRRAIVVRNGRAQTRKVALRAGTMEIRFRRVDKPRRDEKLLLAFLDFAAECWQRVPPTDVIELSLARPSLARLRRERRLSFPYPPEPVRMNADGEHPKSK